MRHAGPRDQGRGDARMRLGNWLATCAIAVLLTECGCVRVGVGGGADGHEMRCEQRCVRVSAEGCRVSGLSPAHPFTVEPWLQSYAGIKKTGIRSLAVVS